MAVDDKKKYAYNYLIGKGLSPIAAAGIVGNLVAESGLNTTIPGKADDKGSIGIAQWHSDRKQGLMTFANKVNKPFSSLSTQLDYLVYELKSPAYSKALAGLNFAKTPGEASIAFMNHYEKPAEWAKKQSVGKRVGEATSIYTGKPYEGVNYSENSEETFRDPNLDFDYNRNPTGTTYTEEELEEAEAETAKQELLQKQKEKDFIAEVQSKEYAPQQQQEIPQEQAPQIDASLYEMPQIALPEYGNTQLPTMQFGGFAEADRAIKEFERAKAAQERNKFLIKDTRKVSATTGKPLNPNSDIVTGKYDKNVIRNLAMAASKHYADPYTSVAVGLQESKLGTTDDNIGHITGKHDTKFTGSEEEDLVRVLQDKLKYAKDLGIEDEATMIQAYNGLGKIFPQTEKGYHGFEMKKIYGVPVPKSGIDMKKTPLYGKRVIDLRDNVIKKNPEVVRYIENLPKYNHFSGKYEEKFNPLPMLNYQEGGLIPGTPEYEKAYNDYNVFNYDKNSDTYVGRELNPVVVQGKPKQKGFWNEYFDNVAREHAQDGVLGAIVGTTVDAVAGLPQKAMTYAFTNKVQTPSQAMNIQNPVGAFAVDAVTDPMNLVGAGILTKEQAFAKMAKSPKNYNSILSEGLFPGMLNETKRGLAKGALFTLEGMKDVHELSKQVARRIDDKIIYPIQYRKQIKDIKNIHNNVRTGFGTPESANRFQQSLGIEAKDLDYPSITTVPGIGSNYESFMNNVNIDFRQIDRLKKEGQMLPAETVHAHEIGHWMGRESYRHSPEYKNRLTEYEKELAKYNSPENQHLLKIKSSGREEDINNWLINAIKDRPSKPLPRTTPTKIDEYAKQLYGYDPSTDMIDISSIPNNINNMATSMNNAKYFTHNGLEPIAHLREMRQNMLDKGLINNINDPISNATIAKFIKENPKDRISSFTKDDYDKISGLGSIFKTLPSAIPAAIGLGAASQIENKKYGGYYPKFN